MIVAVLSLITSLQNYYAPHDFVYSGRHYTNYNNFIIFRESFHHLVGGQNIYAYFVTEHADLFKYSPAFALFMGLFSLLPTAAGLILWNLAGAVLLVAGLRAVVQKPSLSFLLLVLLIPETVACMSNSQSNTHIAGLLMLSFSQLEKNNPGKAAWLLLITVFIKLFTLAFLPLFLFYPRKVRALLSLGVGFTVLFFLPVVSTGWNGLLAQYGNWLTLLKNDVAISSGLGVGGLIGSWTGTDVNKNLILLAGCTLLVAPLIRLRSNTDSWFRASYFCFLLIWVVVFNHKAESPTFIVAMCGVVIHASVMNFEKTTLVLLAGAMLLTSLATTDLFPYDVRRNIIGPYRIKAVMPTLILLVIWVRLMAWRSGAIYTSGSE